MTSCTKTVLAAWIFGVLVPGGVAVAADIAAITRPAIDFSRAETYEAMQGGAGTSRKRVNSNAFSNPAHNLTNRQRMDFAIGNGFFKRVWVSAPASTTAADGLGPLFNARSCQRCHLKDGRGHPPAATHPNSNTAVSMILRLSIPPQTKADRRALAAHRRTVMPEPTYGTQLQNFAIQGHMPEGRISMTHTDLPLALADGTRGDLAATALSGDQSGLWFATPRYHAVAAGRTADDRARPAGNDPGRRHPGPGRSRRRRR